MKINTDTYVVITSTASCSVKKKKKIEGKISVSTQKVQITFEMLNLCHISIHRKWNSSLSLNILLQLRTQKRRGVKEGCCCTQNWSQPTVSQIKVKYLHTAITTNPFFSFFFSFLFLSSFSFSWAWVTHNALAAMGKVHSQAGRGPPPWCTCCSPARWDPPAVQQSPCLPLRAWMLRSRKTHCQARQADFQGPVNW